MKIWDYKSKDDDKLSQQLDKDKNITFTKDEMAKYLISLIDFKNGSKVMEPCKGLGSFYDNIPSNCKKFYCEINENIDYLQDKTIVDYTISNPPFVPRKLFWEFMRVAMRNTTTEIWWLINMISLNVFTPKRLDEMKDNGWFIEQINITADKRWFGRYCFLKISKIDKGFIKWDKRVF